MIIVGSTYRIDTELGIDVTDATSTTFYIQYDGTSTVKNTYPATVTSASTGAVYADVPASDNDEVGKFRVWVKVIYPNDIIRKSAAELIEIYPEGTIG
jgi:hypothetical protein